MGGKTKKFQNFMTIQPPKTHINKEIVQRTYDPDNIGLDVYI